METTEPYFKWRAWDKEAKTMSFTTDPNQVDTWIYSGLVVMQATGYVDKHGQDIYQYDYLRALWGETIRSLCVPGKPWETWWIGEMTPETYVYGDVFRGPKDPEDRERLLVKLRASIEKQRRNE